MSDSLQELYATHRAGIDEVLGNISSFLAAAENKHLVEVTKAFIVDELCALKYLLSSPKRVTKTVNLVQAATAAIEETLRYRHEKRQILADAFDTSKFVYPRDNYIAMTMGGFVNGNLWVCVTHFGSADLREVSKKYGGNVQAIVDTALMSTEHTRLLLDKKSRETGRLCKLLSVVDLEGTSIMKFNSPTTLKAMGQISAYNDHHSPQLLGKIIVVNAPSMFSMILGMFRPFASQSTLDKMGLCGKKRSQADAAACPFLARMGNAKEHIPESMGGGYKVLAG